MSNKQELPKQFDLSKKVVVSLATSTEDQAITVHPKVEKEAAQQTMMSLVQRCNEWNEKKKQSKW